MEQYQKDFISFMVESGVLTFGDFVTKSGRKTPYFINTGNYDTGEKLDQLGQFFAAALVNRLAEPIEVLFGPAYKGIPLAVTTACALWRSHQWQVKVSYDRKETKDHGEGGQLIGYQPKAGDKVVLIDDVTTSGLSLRNSVQLLRMLSPDVNLVGAIVSVDRMERGSSGMSALAELQAEWGLPVFAIVTIEDILEFLYQRPINGVVYIDDKLRAAIADYRAQYGASAPH